MSIVKHNASKRPAQKYTTPKYTVKKRPTTRKAAAPNPTPNAPRNDANVQKLTNELTALSAGIEAHKGKLTQRKNEYTRIFTTSKQLKKPLQQLKENFEALKELTEEFKFSMIEKNLLAENCKGFTELTKKIDVALEYIDRIESDRVKNKYGFEKDYTGQYLTISKSNSKRGITCDSATTEIGNTITDLASGTISIEDAKKIKTKYENLLATSKNSLEKLNQEILAQLTNSENNGNNTVNNITLFANKYGTYQAKLIQSVQNLGNVVEKGHEELEKIKKLSPSDSSAISRLESWIKSLTIPDILKSLNPASAIGSFVFGWALKYITGQN